MATKLSPEESARIEAAFKQCDRDGTGTLDRKAVARLFKRLGQAVGKKELDRMVRVAARRALAACDLFPKFFLLIFFFRFFVRLAWARQMAAADANGDGKIDLGEFCSIVVSSSKHVEQDLRESFVLFDTNGDGFIDAAELKAAMKNFYAVDLTDGEVAEMIAEADSDGNKKIDFVEFKAMMEAMK